MDRFDTLYRLYEEYDADRLRAYQEFVDLFPPLESAVAREYWDDASVERDALRAEIVDGFPTTGGTLADIAAHATRDQAFTALDLYRKYERAVNVLILDVDETLRSAGATDNEIPRETLHLLTELHESGVPIVICTGQTFENVKGFLSQGLGDEVVHSGEVSIVYETGTGVFTAEHGAATKQLLYEDLDSTIQSVFESLRRRVLSDAPSAVQRGCHLQGNEFNVTLKPNFETGSDRAIEIIETALRYLLRLLGEIVRDRVDFDDLEGDDPAMAEEWTAAYYARRDPEIAAALPVDFDADIDEDGGDAASPDATSIPEPVTDLLDRIEVAYYEGDAAEVLSRELNKVVGVEAAFETLGIEDPFALVMGDSKSDRRVMEWLEETDTGIAAAPEHASADVLDHVEETDDLVFSAGEASEVLRTVYALNCHVAAEESE